MLNSGCEPIKRADGANLTWERMDHRIASRIAVYRSGSIDDSNHVLDEITTWAIRGLENLRNVFPKRIHEACKEIDEFARRA